MATIVVFAFKEAERGPLVDPLKAAGHRVVVLEPKDPDFRLALRGYESVDAVVVDLSVKGAQGRECAQWIGEQKRYRSVPVLVTGVPPGDEDVTRAKLPFARRVSLAHLDKAVAHALTPGGKKGPLPTE